MPITTDYIGDSAKIAIPFLYLQFINNLTTVEYFTQTDENGMYDLNAPIGTYTVFSRVSPSEDWIPTGNENYRVNGDLVTNYIDPTQYGVVWDGVADDTDALTDAADAAVGAGLPLVLPPGTGRVSSFIPPSGLTMLGPGANACTIKRLDATTGINVKTIEAADTTDVTFKGFKVDGNVAAYPLIVTEHMHCINAENVTRLTLEDVILTGGKGDGLYVGKGSGHSSIVRLHRVTCDVSYRNGLTVTDCEDFLAVACRFINTVGTAPQAGVDIEPNDNTYVIKGVRFIGCSAKSNAAFGLAVTLYSGGTQERIRWIGGSISSNADKGVQFSYSVNDVELVNVDICDNANEGVYGRVGNFTDITVQGCRIAGNGKEGVRIQPGSPDGGVTPPSVDNFKLLDNVIEDNGAVTVNTYDGILLDAPAGTFTNVLVRGNKSGNRTSVRQRRGFQATTTVSNLTLKDNDLSNNVTGAATLNDDAATRVRANNRGLGELQGFNVTTVMQSYADTASCSAGAGAPLTLTLPAAPEVGRDYVIVDGSGNADTSPITIVANAGDSLRNVGSIVISKPFGVVKLRFRAHNWFLQSMEPPGNNVYSPALVSGQYYRLPHGTLTTAAMTLNTLRLLPVFIEAPVTLTKLAAEITVTGGAGSVVRLGIYADDGTLWPSALVVDAGTIDGTSVTVQELTINTLLQRGWYWFGGVAQVAAPTARTIIPSTGIPTMRLGNALPGAAVVALGAAVTGVSGALPTPIAPSLSGGNPLSIIAKVA